jgi:hypothetical protein
VNRSGNKQYISAEPVPRRRKNAHEEREERQANALKIIKGIRRSPSAPPPIPPPPEPTYIVENGAASGWVYFAYCAGRIKIGYTTNLSVRISQLATSAPMPVTLVLAIAGDESDEADFHVKFSADRAHLEWFRLSMDLRNFIEPRLEPLTALAWFELEAEFHEEANKDLAFISELIGEITEGANHER